MWVCAHTTTPIPPRLPTHLLTPTYTESKQHTAKMLTSFYSLYRHEIISPFDALEREEIKGGT